MGKKGKGKQKAKLKKDKKKAKVTSQIVEATEEDLSEIDFCEICRFERHPDCRGGVVQVKERHGGSFAVCPHKKLEDEHFPRLINPSGHTLVSPQRDRPMPCDTPGELTKMIAKKEDE